MLNSPLPRRSLVGVHSHRSAPPLNDPAASQIHKHTRGERLRAHELQSSSRDEHNIKMIGVTGQYNVHPTRTETYAAYTRAAQRIDRSSFHLFTPISTTTTTTTADEHIACASCRRHRMSRSSGSRILLRRRRRALYSSLSSAS